jgi:hypothetical protein
MWVFLFGFCQSDPNLLGSLHAARCQGTLLERSPQGAWRLVPRVDAQNWPSEAAYQAFRAHYFTPQTDKLLHALKSLHGSEPSP